MTPAATLECRACFLCGQGACLQPMEIHALVLPQCIYIYIYNILYIKKYVMKTIIKYSFIIYHCSIVICNTEDTTMRHLFMTVDNSNWTFYAWLMSFFQKSGLYLYPFLRRSVACQQNLPFKKDWQRHFPTNCKWGSKPLVGSSKNNTEGSPTFHPRSTPLLW